MNNTILSINLFYPLIFFVFCFAIYLTYSLFKMKYINSEHSETKWILHKTFNKNVEHDENILNKVSNDLKEVAFTTAHEIEIHDIEVRLKKIEETIESINQQVDSILKSNNQ